MPPHLTPSNDSAQLGRRGALKMSVADDRHAWLHEAAAKVRKWREEDRANGIVWADEQER